ncbi:hypothetical protein D3C78_1294860 [compost metagenome]
MPVPAITQAMIAPKGPVADPKRPGRLKIPAPTMEPTTIAVSENNVSFCCDVAINIPLPLKYKFSTRPTKASKHLYANRKN